MKELILVTEEREFTEFGNNGCVFVGDKGGSGVSKKELVMVLKFVAGRGMHGMKRRFM